jgi:hypothetical protein
MRSPPRLHRATRLDPDTNATHFSHGSYIVGRTESTRHCRLGKVGTGAGPLAPAHPLRRSYSLEYVEGEFCELRVYGILGSSSILNTANLVSWVS